MTKRVFITGGSGFVGAAIIQALLAADYAVNALVNDKPLLRLDPRVQNIHGGLFDDAVLEKGMKDCLAVIHLVGIIAEKPAKGITFDRIHVQGTQHVVDAAKTAGIKRYVHMSAIGSRADAASAYHRTKFQAEQYVRSSGLDWTIIRPSMIHGPRGEFTRMEIGWARGKKVPFLFMPYFGRGILGLGGAGKLQPVFADDVARAFVESLENPKTQRQIFEIGGPEQFTWPQMHRIVAKVAIGRSRAVIAIPAWYAKAMAAVVPGSLLPFSRDQVVMSQEDNVCDLSAFTSAYGWVPQGFEGTLRAYLPEMG